MATYRTLIDAETQVSALLFRVAGAWIYGLVDPREPERVRYVGRTQQPLVRYATHIHDLDTHGVVKRAWHAELFAADVLPAMLGLEYVGENDRLAKEREHWWIQHFRDTGGADLNVNVRRPPGLVRARRVRHHV